jgi:hypothetical protein
VRCSLRLPSPHSRLWGLLPRCRRGGEASANPPVAEACSRTTCTRRRSSTSFRLKLSSLLACGFVARVNSTSTTQGKGATRRRHPPMGRFVTCAQRIPERSFLGTRAKPAWSFGGIRQLVRRSSTRTTPGLAGVAESAGPRDRLADPVGLGPIVRVDDERGGSGGSPPFRRG